MKKRNSTKVSIKKITIEISIVLLLVIVLFNTTLAKEKLETKTITIKSNQTLWSVAKKICHDSNDKNLYVLDVIEQIKSLNNLTESTIYPGQELNVYLY